MRCPYCGKNRDRVVDSREHRDGATIRRRRECLGCEKRFTSYEQIEDIPYMVVKSDGHREEFQRIKLLGGLLKASEKRPIEREKLVEIVDRVEAKLRDSVNREIPAQEIGEMVMGDLRDIDQVTYVRFASVYRRFEDVGEFMNELKHLLTHSKRSGSPK